MTFAANFSHLKMFSIAMASKSLIFTLMMGIFLPFNFKLKAEELTLTVGQAFDLAYRRFLEKKALNDNSKKKLNEMEEKIKTAEEEKEALKQKIAELEIAAGQGSGPPSSNGSNEVRYFYYFFPII